ncbi:MAG: hypothetical protein HQ523_03510 [Lentisphaerae bacterium]|nr:hypothetical protein [Lentisphaerota bacterium]
MKRHRERSERGRIWRAAGVRVWLTARMQIRQSSIRGDRPDCPVDPRHRIHSNGSYKRHTKADGEKKEKVPRWLCTAGCCTISVLPDTCLPYRPVGGDLFESWLDTEFMGRAPPQVTENEKGCLDRALKRFLQRIPSLTEVLGQMIKVLSPTATQLWGQLRKLGKLTEILRFLAEKFKTSLLGDYRCLRPPLVSG